jgi:hypothetical protein
MKDRQAVIINKESMKGIPNQLMLEIHTAMQTKEYPSNRSCLLRLLRERKSIIAPKKSGTGLKNAGKGRAILGVTKTGSIKKIDAPARTRTAKVEVLFIIFYQ